jgi:sulfoxide reductase catalytic subunit YedY
MNFIRRPSWHLPERETTPESVFLNRRALMAGAGALAIGAIAGAGSRAEAGPANRPWTPAPAKNPAYIDAGRAVTPEAYAEWLTEAKELYAANPGARTVEVASAD